MINNLSRDELLNDMDMPVMNGVKCPAVKPYAQGDLLIEAKKSGKYSDHSTLEQLAGLTTPDLSTPTSKVQGSSTKYPKHQAPKHAIDDNPKTKYLKIEVSQIKDVIGRGGETINKIIEEITVKVCPIIEIKNNMGKMLEIETAIAIYDRFAIGS